MNFGDLTTNHLGRAIRVRGGHNVIIGAIHHELYHGKPRTVLFDSGQVRRWIYVSDRECILL